MKLSAEGKEREFDGGILFVAVCGTLLLSLVPFLKYYTRWSNTHSSSIALQWQFALRKKEVMKTLLAEKEGPKSMKNVFFIMQKYFTYVSFLALL